MAGEENVDPDLYDFKPTKRRRKVPIEPSKRFKVVILISVGVRKIFFFIAEFKSPSHALVSAVEWNPKLAAWNYVGEAEQPSHHGLFSSIFLINIHYDDVLIDYFQ